MDLNILINRVKKIVLSPQKEWITIKDENSTVRDLIMDYAGPLITLGSITLFLRNLSLEYSLAGTLMTAMIYFISMFGSMYLSALIIVEMCDSFGIEKNKTKIFTLVIYSSIAFYLAQVVVNLHNQLSLLTVFSLYTVYLYWIGVGVYFEGLSKRKMGFVVISVFIIYISFLLLQYILSPLLIIANNPNFIQF